MGPPLESILTLALAALVLAGGSLPPGFRHEHSTASPVHSHRSEVPPPSDSPPPHDHGDHGPSHHHHDEPAEHESTFADGPASHVHFDLFGFSLAVADPAEADEDGELGRMDFESGPVRIAVDRLTDPGDAPCWLAMLDSATRDPDPLDLPAGFEPSAPFGRSCTPHLGDAARRERSGVLRI